MNTFDGEMINGLVAAVEKAEKRSKRSIRFVALHRIVMYGSAFWCRAVSHEKAKLIAKALNKYRHLGEE